MRKIFITLLMLASFSASAITMSQVSDNLMVPAAMLSGLMSIACYIVGICMTFGAMMQYQVYRANPKIAPLGKILFVAATAIALLILPYFAENYGGIKDIPAKDKFAIGQEASYSRVFEIFNNKADDYEYDSDYEEYDAYQAELEEYS